MRRTAAELRVGESGVVTFLTGEPSTVRRLIDLGITENAVIVVKKAAPFGGPLEIEVKGSRLGIRREQAKNIVLQEK
ncbi:MAG: FeoA family protein [Firmicutes bacterium]|nr:FeoA family protein [Bacillota bacterium]